MTDVPAAPSAKNSARVRIKVGPLVGPVLSRVVGMLAARADCPVDRLDDALMVVDALAAHGTHHVPDGRITVRVSTAPQRLELRVGPLKPEGAQSLVRDATLPGVGNVLERIADQLEFDTDQASGGEVLVIGMGFA